MSVELFGYYVQCKELSRLNERLDELDQRQQRQLSELRDAVVDTTQPQRSAQSSLNNHHQHHHHQQQQQQPVDRRPSPVDRLSDHRSDTSRNRYTTYTCLVRPHTNSTPLP